MNVLPSTETPWSKDGWFKAGGRFPTLIHAASHYTSTVNTTPLLRSPPPGGLPRTPRSPDSLLLQGWSRGTTGVGIGCMCSSRLAVCCMYLVHCISLNLLFTLCTGRPSTHKSSEGPISWPLYIPAPSAAPSTQRQSQRITTSSRAPSLDSREDREELAVPWLAGNERRLPSAILNNRSASRGLGGVVKLPRESLRRWRED